MGLTEVNPYCVATLAGHKSTYAYAAVFSKVQGKFSGIVKFDLSAKNGGAVVGQIEHGPERYGGEAVFVKGNGPGELSPVDACTMDPCQQPACKGLHWNALCAFDVMIGSTQATWTASGDISRESPTLRPA